MMPVARLLLYVGTAFALALVGRSLIIGPISAPVAVASFVLYLALVLCGVFFLELEMFVDVMRRGPRGARGVALTFDDGPSPEHTPKVLDMLDDAGVRATFFVIGRKVAAHPAIAKEIVERGHTIGIHGYAHDRLFALRSPDVIREDLEDAILAVERATGVRPVLFRPPIGYTSPRVARALEDLDLTVVGSSVRSLDGFAGTSHERVASRVIRALRDGAIVLLHDASEDDRHEPATIRALPAILAAMKRLDLKGVALDRWL